MIFNGLLWLGKRNVLCMNRIEWVVVFGKIYHHNGHCMTDRIGSATDWFPVREQGDGYGDEPWTEGLYHSPLEGGSRGVLGRYATK